MDDSQKDITKKPPVTGGSAVASSLVSNGQAPAISSKDVAEEFQSKMRKIRLAELEELTKQQAANASLPYIDLTGFPISDTALKSLARDVAQKEKMICFFNNEKEVRLGVLANTPRAQEVLDEIIKKHTVDGSGKIYLISQNSFDLAEKNYDRLPEFKKFEYGLEITGKQLEELKPLVSNFGNLNGRLNTESNMTTIFAMIITGAMTHGASDIHIEAEETSVVLRYRIDGVMQQAAKLEREVWKRLDSRIKTIAHLKINITDRPQDGRITIHMSETDKLEIRVSTLPTSYGESIVMRLLKSGVASLEFDNLGLRGKAYEDLKKAVEKTTGMVVTTGPTGSGKTTTLYAILNKLNNGEDKIITLEDPVEYKIAGISQSQIDHAKGYSFADGLRSILRQDPDVVMVGELRDLETVEVSLQAALTGHKVLSTIHTNDAAGAVPRFLSMGAQPFLLAPALNAIIGQRLIRKICSNCVIETTLEPAIIQKAQEIINNLPDNSGYGKVDLSTIKFKRGGGCDVCGHIGYKGRLGIYEIVAMNKEFESMILSGNVSAYDMADAAKKHGMITMQQDGILKAIDGITTLDEVFRVIG
ncbi:Flp pilus assembly complex ATPase component TadA [Candidatus Falkowbacteria bacterium]|nr:Flp pilus assembly complex ATPase component TadA [Candidatus Falkowbacteria bacterium]